MEMKKSSIAALFSGLLLAAQGAMAQCPTPQAQANPNSLLAGRAWAFTTRAGDFFPPGAGSAGRFTATLNGASGLLQIIGSFADGIGGVTRLASISGRFLVNPDCSGGQLSFNFSNQPTQYEFVFLANFTELYMVSTSVINQHASEGEGFMLDTSNGAFGGSLVYTGRAKAVAVTGCPIGVNPLNVLAGTAWSFQALPPGFASNAFNAASIGTFRPTVAPNSGGFQAGTLSVTQTINTSGNVARQSTNSGRFSVNADCSGGDLLFNLGGNQSQFSFFFSDSSFSEMFMITDNVSAGFDGTSFMLGIARRQ